MIEIICLLFPALFSVFALERLLAKKLSLRNFAFVFVTNTIIVNVKSLFITYCVAGTASMPLSTSNGIRLTYSVIYLVISMIVTAILVCVERFYFYRLRISVSDSPKTKDENNNSGEDKKA